MSEESSPSSSLHTDSDWYDLEDQCRKSSRSRQQPTNEAETLPTEKLTLRVLQKNSSSSRDISSNPSVVDEDIIENDSYLKTEKLSEVNLKLRKKFSNALMGFKSVVRPFNIRTKASLHEMQNNLVRDLKDLDYTFPADERPAKALAWSLNKIRELKIGCIKSRLTLEEGLKHIKEADIERSNLKERIDTLSQDLNQLVEKKSDKVCKCDCLIF
jgi:hypothetical protein